MQTLKCECDSVFSFDCIHIDLQKKKPQKGTVHLLLQFVTFRFIPFTYNPSFPSFSDFVLHILSQG